MIKSLKECYFRFMSSQAAEKAIRFCGGNYKECDIYQKYLTEEVQSA